MLADDRHVGSVERLLHLKKAPMIGNLEPHLLAVVAEASRPRVFRKGELLLREGERADACFFLLEGRLHLERGGRVVAHAEAGASLGGLRILARRPAAVTATAQTDVLALELRADTILDLLEDHFGIVRHFLREVTCRVIENWQRIPQASPYLHAERPPTRAAARDLDLVERIFFLRQLAPFEQASINALAELARALSEVHHVPGERLWCKGEPAHHVVLVVAGEVDCRWRAGFAFKGPPGAPLGALEAIAASPRWYDAYVSEPLTGLTGEIEALFDVFEDNIEMAIGFLTAMSKWEVVLAERLAEQAPEMLGGFARLAVSRPEEPERSERPSPDPGQPPAG